MLLYEAMGRQYANPKREECKPAGLFGIKNYA